jgi:antitoxin component of RelBE/YafQ-DinJ toxin-antitoxin module
MSAVNFNMRLEEDLRNDANHIFEEYGLTMPQAFKLFKSSGENKDCSISF